MPRQTRTTRTRTRRARVSKAPSFPVATLRQETVVTVTASCGDELRFIRDGERMHVQKKDSYDSWDTECSFNIKTLPSLCEALAKLAE